ncbi:helix-turn-helix domain-containing protein [Wenjunlia tyrosinilytica]|uniref:helix-turn-helix domain-containing protein n=1 Tax=Wenjunlia tyrosinilytica TaxID=1544741 RepID=UPI00166384B4|nr:helix-turn-helix domain-containing protein [Wenjunlia tyrosinilytica]
MLGAVGLDEIEETTYRTLVGLGAADVADLARRLGHAEDDILRTLHRLEQHGLAAHSSGRPDRYVAAPPAVALGALLSRQRQGLEQAEAATRALAREYRSGATGREAHDLVEVVTGTEAVRHRFEQLRQGAAEEVCALVTEAPVVPDGPHDDAPAQACGRGVRSRMVVERDVLADPGGITGLRAALERGMGIRVADKVPTRLVVVDRSLGMVPLVQDAVEPNALVVHASGLLDSLLSLFDAVWARAQPVHLADGDAVVQEGRRVPDGVDLQILSLLLAGFTDTSVAKQLDLGLRTVQRRVKRLMELAQVTTRLQLGWHAYEKGWVARRGRGGGRSPEWDTDRQH